MDLKKVIKELNEINQSIKNLLEDDDFYLIKGGSIFIEKPKKGIIQLIYGILEEDSVLREIIGNNNYACINGKRLFCFLKNFKKYITEIIFEKNQLKILTSVPNVYYFEGVSKSKVDLIEKNFYKFDQKFVSKCPDCYVFNLDNTILEKLDNEHPNMILFTTSKHKEGMKSELVSSEEAFKRQKEDNVYVVNIHPKCLSKINNKVAVECCIYVHEDKKKFKVIITVYDKFISTLHYFACINYDYSFKGEKNNA